MNPEIIAWANERPTTSPSAHLVLVQLASLAEADGVVRRLDFEWLARVSKQSRTSVFKRLGEFERAGWLTRERVGYASDGSPIVLVRLHIDGKA
jgi:hypothetical protein